MLLVLSSCLVISGCNESDKKATKDVKTKDNATVLKELEKICNEEFISVSLKSNVKNQYAFSPKNNQNLVFTAKIDEDGNISNNYTEALFMHLVEIQFNTNLKMDGYENKTSVELLHSVDYTKYLNSDEIKNLKENDTILAQINIIIDNADLDEKAIIESVKNIAEQYDYIFVIKGYVFDNEKYKKCAEEFNQLKTCCDEYIKEYEPYKEFNAMIYNGMGTMIIENSQVSSK